MVKNPPASAEDRTDVGSIPELGRSLGGEISMENPMDRGIWRATVHGVTESDTTEVT